MKKESSEALKWLGKFFLKGILPIAALFTAIFIFGIHRLYPLDHWRFPFAYGWMVALIIILGAMWGGSEETLSLKGVMWLVISSVAVSLFLAFCLSEKRVVLHQGTFACSAIVIFIVCVIGQAIGYFLGVIAAHQKPPPYKN